MCSFAHTAAAAAVVVVVVAAVDQAEGELCRKVLEPEGSGDLR